MTSNCFCVLFSSWAIDTVPGSTISITLSILFLRIGLPHRGTFFMSKLPERKQNFAWFTVTAQNHKHSHSHFEPTDLRLSIYQRKTITRMVLSFFTGVHLWDGLKHYWVQWSILHTSYFLVPNPILLTFLALSNRPVASEIQITRAILCKNDELLSTRPLFAFCIFQDMWSSRFLYFADIFFTKGFF